MEHTILFEEQVSLTANDLSKKIVSINDILLKKLKEKLENKCSRNGFLKKDTLVILSRSMGKCSTGRFVGDYIYYVHLQGKVLNPSDGIVIKGGEIISKNKMGIYVNYQNAIRIILPRDLHIDNEEYDSLNVGAKIDVEIKKSRFQVNDETILSVGIYIGQNIGQNEMDSAESDDSEEEDIIIEGNEQL